MYMKTGTTSLLTVAGEDDWTTLSLAMETDEGDALDALTFSETEGVWSATMAHDALDGLSGHYLKRTWTFETSAPQTASWVDYVDVLDHDPQSWLGSIRDLKDYLNLGDSHAEDSDLMRLIEDASAAIDRKYGPITCPTELATRVRWCDGSLLVLPEPVDITTVEDADGEALVYIDPGDGSIVLHRPYTGLVSVTGTWGTDEPDSDVSRAVKVQAGKWYRLEKMGEGNAYGQLSALSKEVTDLMDARRIVRF